MSLSRFSVMCRCASLSFFNSYSEWVNCGKGSFIFMSLVWAVRTDALGDFTCARSIYNIIYCKDMFYDVSSDHSSSEASFDMTSRATCFDEGSEISLDRAEGRFVEQARMADECLLNFLVGDMDAGKGGGDLIAKRFSTQERP
jgi:hypothetical protein